MGTFMTAFYIGTLMSACGLGNRIHGLTRGHPHGN
jgi:hypothetical protein